jgi:hypothetical protein
MSEKSPSSSPSSDLRLGSCQRFSFGLAAVESWMMAMGMVIGPRLALKANKISKKLGNVSFISWAARYTF